MSALLWVAYVLLFLPIVGYAVAYQSGGKEWPRPGVERGAAALAMFPLFGSLMALVSLVELGLGHVFHPFISLLGPAIVSGVLTAWAVEGPGQAMAKRIHALSSWKRRVIGMGATVFALVLFFGGCTAWVDVDKYLISR